MDCNFLHPIRSRCIPCWISGVLMKNADEETIRLLESTPATTRKKNMVHGVGINDVNFVVTMYNMKGDRVIHPAYSVWASMLRRCYNEKNLIEYPNYSGVKVCDEWLSFKNFHSFWSKNRKPNHELDKDILIIGNKEYNEDTCVFVPHWVNTLILIQPKTSKLPIGVSYLKRLDSYRATIRKEKSQYHLGLFKDPISANHAWFKEKVKHLNENKMSLDEVDPRLFHSLFFKIESLRAVR